MKLFLKQCRHAGKYRKENSMKTELLLHRNLFSNWEESNPGVLLASFPFLRGGGDIAVQSSWLIFIKSGMKNMPMETTLTYLLSFCN
jgi:hypothetical protein